MTKQFKLKIPAAALAIATLVFNACVPARQYDEMKLKKATCEEENAKLKTETASYISKNDELNSRNAEQKKQIEKLENDTTSLGTAQRRLTNLYNELSNSYEKLVANNDKLLASKADETKKVIGQLQMTQEELIKKQDEMAKKEAALNELQASLGKMQGNLKEREEKVRDLQRMLDQKDSVANALRNIVSKALTGFEGNGLTITKKDGNVYVSMDEKLLFASGSTVVDKRGEDALKQLAQVLESNKDINVRIEGHTDNVPISGGPIKDNWDLSVLRATSVTRILTKYGATIDPVRLIPSGRGPYLPVEANTTAEAKRKNRRIEVVLIPKLGDLMDAVQDK